jgi:hypothetical protein
MDRMYGPKYVRVIRFLWESVGCLGVSSCFSSRVFTELIICSGNPFAAAMCLIVLHSFCLRESLSGSEFIRRMRNWYAAILCSVGWLDR